MRRLFVFVALTGAVGVGCGGTEPPGPPTELIDLSGTSLAGTVGQELLGPLRVRVVDAEGRGVPDVPVNFSVVAGGGDLTPVSVFTASSQAQFGRAAPALADSTDANGEVAAVWTLGTTAGEQTVSIAVTGVPTLLVTAVAAPGEAAELSFSANSAFIGIAGAAADGPIGVTVRDQFGNPVPDAAVTWAAVAGGGSVEVENATTDALGVAQTTVTLGPSRGLHLYTAAVGALGPDTIAVVAVTGFADPSGDQFPSGDPGLTSHDVRFVGMANFGTTTVLYIRFSQPVTAATEIGPQPAGAVSGILDFDLDQDTTTGYLALRRCLGIDSVPFGSDGFVDLDARSLPDSLGFGPRDIAVIRVDSLETSDRCGSLIAAGEGVATQPVYRDSTISIFFPSDLFLNDVVFDFTGVVASSETLAITDLAPDSLPFGFDLSAAASVSSSDRMRADTRFIRSAAVLRGLGYRQISVLRLIQKGTLVVPGNGVTLGQGLRGSAKHEMKSESSYPKVEFGVNAGFPKRVGA